MLGPNPPGRRTNEGGSMGNESPARREDLGIRTTPSGRGRTRVPRRSSAPRRTGFHRRKVGLCVRGVRGVPFGSDGGLRVRRDVEGNADEGCPALGGGPSTRARCSRIATGADGADGACSGTGQGGGAGRLRGLSRGGTAPVARLRGLYLTDSARVRPRGVFSASGTVPTALPGPVRGDDRAGHGFGGGCSGAGTAKVHRRGGFSGDLAPDPRIRALYMWLPGGGALQWTAILADLGSFFSSPSGSAPGGWPLSSPIGLDRHERRTGQG
jgi:hypothetical protein